MLALASLAAGARCQVNQEIYSEQDLLAIDSEAKPVAVAVLPPPGFEAASASVLSSLPPGEHHQVLENLFNSFFIIYLSNPNKISMLLSVVFLWRVDSCDQTADGDDAMFQVEVSLAVARARCRQTAPTASGGCGTLAPWHTVPGVATAPTRR